jgi:hypothetical protein
MLTFLPASTRLAPFATDPPTTGLCFDSLRTLRLQSPPLPLALDPHPAIASSFFLLSAFNTHRTLIDISHIPAPRFRLAST